MPTPTRTATQTLVPDHLTPPFDERTFLELLSAAFVRFDSEVDVITERQHTMTHDELVQGYYAGLNPHPDDAKHAIDEWNDYP